MLQVLVAPLTPTLPTVALKKFKIRAPAAPLDNLEQFVRFARMFALSRTDHIDLPPAGRQGPRVLSAHTKENKFRDVSEVETDASPVGSTILWNL